MKNYALAKAVIFRNQTPNQKLVLNYDNKWTPFFLKQKPRAKICFFSIKHLPERNSGVFYRNGWIYFQVNGRQMPVLRTDGFINNWGGHNLENLLASSLAANLANVPWEQIQEEIKTLPQIPFRQETIFDGSVRLTTGNGWLKIINDTSATSPDGGIAAVRRFGSPSMILITGGTDRQLDYSQWAKVVKRKIKPENVIFLAGSATEKMIKELRNKNYELRIKDTLNECVKYALIKAGTYSKSVILFSPAAKSFEKFQNEFDRGRQFNELVKRLRK